jgi:hypothetical protein
MTLAKPAIQMDEKSTTPQASCVIIVPQALEPCDIMEVSGVELNRALKKGL